MLLMLYVLFQVDVSRLRSHAEWDDLYSRVLATSTECSEPWSGLSEDTKLETLEALRLLNVGNGAEVCNNDGGSDSSSGGGAILAIVIPLVLIVLCCGGYFLFYVKKNASSSVSASGGRHQQVGGKASKTTPSSDDDLCVICLNGPKTHLFTSCGHKCVCGGCASELLRSQQKACPMCRVVTTTIVKVFD